jgi:hypothetical protein
MAGKYRNGLREAGNKVQKHKGSNLKTLQKAGKSNTI